HPSTSGRNPSPRLIFRSDPWPGSDVRSCHESLNRILSRHSAPHENQWSMDEEPQSAFSNLRSKFPCPPTENLQEESCLRAYLFPINIEMYGTYPPGSQS